MGIYTNRLKSMFVVILVGLALYQTMQLWFEDISSRNFFYEFFTRKVEMGSEEYDSYLHTPYRTIIRDADRYIIDMGGKNNQDKNTPILENVFMETFKNLSDFKYESTDKLDWKELLENTSFMFEYKFLMDTEVFLKSIDKKNSNLNNRIKEFDLIVLSSTIKELEPYSIYFINTKEGTVSEFTLSNKNKSLEIISQAWRESRENISAGDYKLLYEASEQLQLPTFTGNVFLPKWEGKDFEYKGVNISNPYSTEDKQTPMDYIIDEVALFFENSSEIIRKPVEEDNNYLYGSANRIVKYYIYQEDGKRILEYYDYDYIGKGIEKLKANDIVESYKTALKFIKKDTHNASNDYYLDSYEVDAVDAGKITFYFDAHINNLPIVLSDNLKKSNEMDHHMEITLEHGKVSRYKKVYFNYSVSDVARVTADENYVDSLNTVGFSKEKDKINNIQLVYNVSGKRNSNMEYENPTLYWIFDIEGSPSSSNSAKKRDIPNTSFSKEEAEEQKVNISVEE